MQSQLSRIRGSFGPIQREKREKIMPNRNNLVLLPKWKYSTVHYNFCFYNNELWSCMILLSFLNVFFANNFSAFFFYSLHNYVALSISPHFLLKSALHFRRFIMNSRSNFIHFFGRATRISF